MKGKQTFYILVTNLQDVDGFRFDLGHYEVKAEEYTLKEMLTLGWSKNFVDGYVFENKNDAYRQLIKLTAEQYQLRYKDIKEKQNAKN